MSDSDLTNAGIIQVALRSICMVIDKVFFGLLVVVFQIFFNVASAELFTGDAVLKFVGRVQLILGVFTMFQLAMSILKGIVNPDQFFSKDKGFSNVITKIVTALFLLAVIMPISIPGAQNEYEKQVNNNGILFGTLYSLQHRLLSNNTLGKLILGSNNSSATFMGDNNDELKSASNIFASTILKTFVKINLIDESERTHVDGKTDDQISSNWVCSDMNDYVDLYKKDDVDPQQLLSLVNDSCGADDRGAIGNALSMITASDYFKFTYSPIISTIVAGIFTFILLGFCVDVAMRAVKLSVLRIIAPVPIISYMNPTGGKDSALNSWVKTLTSTYLDLFIRLATVYFAIFLVMDIIANGIVINVGFRDNPIIGGVSTVLIFIGIFFFAKEAPKFIKDMLGLKGDMTMFGGIGKALGIGAAGLGVIGSARAGFNASVAADKANHASTTGFKGMWNRGKHLAAGIAGGITGGYAGVNAAMTAKDHAFKSSINAMGKHNADVLARGADGSTILGRARTTGARLFSGESAASKEAREIASLKSRQSALDAIKKRVSGEMVKNDHTSGSLGIATDRAGNAIGDVNYKSFMASYAEGQSRGDGLVRFTDVNGHSHEISFADADKQKGFLLKNNEDSYIRQAVTPGSAITDNDLASLIADADAKGGAHSAASGYESGSGPIDSRDAYTKSSENLGIEIRERELANARNKVNDMYADKK